MGEYIISGAVYLLLFIIGVRIFRKSAKEKEYWEAQFLNKSLKLTDKIEDATTLEQCSQCTTELNAIINDTRDDWSRRQVQYMQGMLDGKTDLLKKLTTK